MQTVLFNNGQPIEWGKPDSFVTAIMCALSLSFPVGEDFFIEALQKGFDSLPTDLQKKWKTEVNRFCDEENNHSRAHSIHNEKYILTYGFVNGWGERAKNRVTKMYGKNPKHYVASTAAIEHITTVMACWLLQNQHILDNAEPETKKLWIWHSTEEINHSKVAIDLYRDMGGSEEWRIRWMKIMFALTLIEGIRQTISNIWNMGGFFKLATWINAYKLLFSEGGFIRWCYPYFKAYGQHNYHISQHDAVIELALQSKGLK